MIVSDSAMIRPSSVTSTGSLPIGLMASYSGERVPPPGGAKGDGVGA